ncbi:LLM class flavin-dependent oxidoreductase [Aeromicrobium panaciterrae]|uniref:LLM class flavin-dependent oxidoreductase n=1 Tax=Aeromicrobium panaciterrae TaxID=363861 RepID=UPI0031E0F116
MVKLGLVFDLRNPQAWARPMAQVYASALDVAEEADRLGIGGLWFSEHHRFVDGYLPQPLTFAAAVAARTRQARLGTCVMQPALRIPAQLAEEAAVVDILSSGRLELGVGAGYRVPEFELFGVEGNQRYERTEAAITEIRRMWADGSVTPPPVQGSLPVWGGFYGPRGARLAGRLGMGLLYMSRARFADYSAALVAAGHPAESARVSGLMPIILADDPDRTLHEIAPHLAHQQDTYAFHEAEGTGKEPRPPVDPYELTRPGPDGAPASFQVLTPQDAAIYLRERSRDLPVEHLILWASIAAMPEHVVNRHVELVCHDLTRELGIAP